MSLEGRRVLFISYNGMLQPLGQTQVLTYLRELAKRGVKFTLLSFERDNAFTPAGARECATLKDELQRQGIEWHWLRYHQRPSLPATLFDVVRGIRVASRLVRKNEIELVHAEEILPAYVIYDLAHGRNVATIREWLREQRIWTAGRFGEWQYLNMDHSMASGKAAAEAILADVSA